MRALVTDRSSPAGVKLRRDYPTPQPRPGEVLLRTRHAGICSTDLEIVRGYMQYEGVLGHEFVATVAEGDPQLLGKRVVAEINCTAPGLCPTHAQRKHHFPRTVLGILQHDGAFADYLAVPAENCHLVPDHVSDEQAVFVEPLAAACQVVADHPDALTHQTAVLGSGRLGILCALALQAAGGQPLVLGRNPDSLARCRTLGLATRNVRDVAAEPQFETLVECTGNAEGLKFALATVQPRGTIVLKSTYAEPPTVDLAPVVINELRVAGNRCGPFAEALRLLDEQRLDLTPLIAARFPLDQAEHAFARAAEPGTLKVLLDCTADGA